jgi:hypothetical protein
MTPRDRIDHHETDIVPIAGIALARIAEPNKKQHRVLALPRSSMQARLVAIS